MFSLSICDVIKCGLNAVALAITAAPMPIRQMNSMILSNTFAISRAILTIFYASLDLVCYHRPPGVSKLPVRTLTHRVVGYGFIPVICLNGVFHRKVFVTALEANRVLQPLDKPVLDMLNY